MRQNDLLTITQAANEYHYAGVDRQQIAYAASSGALKTVTRRPKARRVGAPIRYRIRRSDLEQWLNTHEQAVSGAPEGHVEVKEAADKADISAAVVYDAIRKGGIAHRKVEVEGRGRARSRIYVKVEDVLRWKREHGARRFVQHQRRT